VDTGEEDCKTLPRRVEKWKDKGKFIVDETFSTMLEWNRRRV
jgi:hypothetical protein